MDIMKSLSLSEKHDTRTGIEIDACRSPHAKLRSRLNAMKTASRNGTIYSEELKVGERSVVIDDWTVLASINLEGE